MAQTVSRRSIVYDLTFDTSDSRRAVSNVGKELDKVGSSIDKASDQISTFSDKTLTAVQRLRQIKNELNNFKGTKERFEELSTEAARLQDQLDKTNQRIRTLASSTRNVQALISAFQGLAGILTAAQGASALFGDRNEDLTKTLVKLQGSLALLQGLQAAIATVTEQSAAKTIILSNAQKVYTFITQGATAATRALNAALVVTIGGAIITGLILLISYWDKLGFSVESVTEKLKKHREALKLYGEQVKGVADGLKELYEVQKGGTKDIERQIQLLRASGASEKELFENQQKLREQELNNLKSYLKDRTHANGVFLGSAKEYNEIFQAIKNKENEITAASIEFQRKQLAVEAQINLLQKQSIAERLRGTEFFSEAQKNVLEAQLKADEKNAILTITDTNLLYATLQKIRAEYLTKVKEINNQIVQSDTGRSAKEIETNLLNDLLNAGNDKLKENLAQRQFITENAVLERIKIEKDELISFEEKEAQLLLLDAKTKKQLRDNEKSLEVFLDSERLADINSEANHQKAIQNLIINNGNSTIKQKQLASDRLFDIESERLQKEKENLELQLDAQLITQEEYARKVIAIDDAIAKNKIDKINATTANQIRLQQELAKVLGISGQAFSDLASLAAQGSELQLAFSIASVLAQQAQAIAAAIAGATTSASASGPAAFALTPVFIATMVGTVISTFAQVFSLISQAKAAAGKAGQVNAVAFAEGEIDIHAPGEKRGKDSIPAMIMPGESVITTEKTARYKPFLEAIHAGTLEDLIHVNYIEPALVAQGLSSSNDSKIPDYSEKFYRQYLVTGEGNSIHKKSAKTLERIEKKLGKNIRKRYV